MQAVHNCDELLKYQQ